MAILEEEGRESETPLLDGEKIGIGGTVPSTDWLGRPTDHRHDLGGWSCSAGVIGSYIFVFSAFLGVTANLVLYLVDEWGESNAGAARNVNNIGGTTLFCSFLGGFISDSYTGRLWGSIIFEILMILSFMAVSLVDWLISSGQASQSAVSKKFLLGSFYCMAVACGSSFPNLTSLGADQLLLQHQKAKYFNLIAMSMSTGQIFATTAITYLDESDRWALGFWLCTTASGAALVSTLCVASKCRVYRAGGNPLVRVGQVLVSATRNRNVSVPADFRLLHEVEGDMSAIPGCRKLFHTDSIRCLDKAAVMNDNDVTAGPWRLCTVTQVEEVKCLMRVLPVGLATLSVGCALAQVSSLFEEQAAATNGKLVGGLTIAPASLQLFYIAGALSTGFVYDSIIPLMKRSKSCNHRSITSLQLQGMALLVSIVAMTVSALVEAYRLDVAQASGSLIYASWLVPQNFLLGMASNLLFAGRIGFFYNEVSDGMRTMGSSIGFLYSGASNYLSSFFILLVTTITTRDGSSGWIADDLNDGHLDYFYWFLACFLTFAFGIYLLYAHFYTYRENVTTSKVELNTDKDSTYLNNSS